MEFKLERSNFQINIDYYDRKINEEYNQNIGYYILFKFEGELELFCSKQYQLKSSDPYIQLQGLIKEFDLKVEFSGYDECYIITGKQNNDTLITKDLLTGLKQAALPTINDFIKDKKNELLSKFNYR